MGSITIHVLLLLNSNDFRCNYWTALYNACDYTMIPSFTYTSDRRSV